MSKSIKYLVLLLVVMSAGAATFALTRKSDDKKSTPVSQAPAKQAPVVAKSEVKMPELGISLKVPESIKDLKYSVETKTGTDGKVMTTAYFTTPTLEYLDPACSTKAPGALGSINKVAGQYPTDDATKAVVGTLAKQFKDFYVSIPNISAYCSQKQDAKQLFREQYTDLSASRDSISELQK